MEEALRESENSDNDDMGSRTVEPLLMKRLEASLDMGVFMRHARHILAQPLSSGDDESGEEGTVTYGDKRLLGDKQSRFMGSKLERQNMKEHLYNFSDLTSDREWLYDVIMTDTDAETDISDEDDYVKELLKTHVREQKHRENFYKKTTNTQYAYYASGMLSHHDMYPEHQQSIVGVRKRKRRTKKEKPLKPTKLAKMRLPKIRKPRKKRLVEQPEPGEIDPADLSKYAYADTMPAADDEDDDDDGFTGEKRDSAASAEVHGKSGRGRRRKNLVRTPAFMAARRRRVWQTMAKKELGRGHRAKMNNHKEVVQNCKRVATMCMKVVRQRAMSSQKVMKETVWRAKRLTREMMTYWKRAERVERDTRRRMEREAEEKRKIDVEIIEAKRQQRKLNFLITQTELYAHFMSKKLGQGSEEEQLRILSQLDEDINPRLAAYDDYDADHMKLLAQQHAESAFDADRAKTNRFDSATRIKIESGRGGEADESPASSGEIKVECDDEPEEVEMPAKPAAALEQDLPQPNIFKGTLKAYQIKGMTWLANLYDQGISGILADEMGLGKTVQSIAFLCHIAERYGVWGPFLIISPASTLHNWQQELQRFVPDFNVVPYWGTPNERKILRQFWDQKDLHTKGASFHVVVTSYQLIVSDYKYFNRLKWQYMVLDEAQAIKSSSSMRWKLLLGFNCRNRLLLSGTPIQNSMAELWALLHFIMPTLFDSHDEFNEWFSKDIESHAENKTGIDEKQISRLHMILKPFMLRRIKKDVENELSDKIEIMVYCPLTIRQKLLYMALKKKIRIEDLLHAAGGGGGGATHEGHHVDRNFTSNLMNLVMQFRKVCNHPELFERRDVKSPLAMRCEEYVLPRLFFEEALHYRAIPSRRHLIYNKFSIYKVAYSHRTIFGEDRTPSNKSKTSSTYPRYVDLAASREGGFSFSRLSDMSPKEIEDTTIGGIITLLCLYREQLRRAPLLRHRRVWWSQYYGPTRLMLLEPSLDNPLQKHALSESSVLRHLLFTGRTTNESEIYAFGDYHTVNMQETIEHRVIRSKILKDRSNLIEELESRVDAGDAEALEDASSVVSMNAAKATGPDGKKSKIDDNVLLLPKFLHVKREPTQYYCEPLAMPRFLYGLSQRVQAVRRRLYCENRSAEWSYIRHTQCDNPVGLELVNSGLEACKPRYGWSSIVIPDKQTLVTDAGKLAVLDSLLTRLKSQGHRVLIYSQMTKMIDLLEEYMWHRKHRYMRLDGSSKISARRDMVADFQTRADIFVFLLSTRAGGLGINLTAADTVIFYDSDWNPTVDQQAMDRAHRLGQTKQVTVYRLICKGTIEERILQRAREKSEIQRMVISGGNFKPDTLKPKEVVSLLLDDEEIETKYRQRVGPNDTAGNGSQYKDTPAADKKRRPGNKPSGSSSSTAHTQSGGITIPAAPSTTPPTKSDDSPLLTKRPKLEASEAATNDEDSIDMGVEAAASSSNSSPSTSMMATTPKSGEPFVPGATTVHAEDSDNEAVIVDCESPMQSGDSPTLFDDYGALGPIRRRHHPRGTKRGRPRGSTRRGMGMGRASGDPATPTGNTTGAESPHDQTDFPSPMTPGMGDAAAGNNSGNASFADNPALARIKRGPGRPRLKTAGPKTRGSRGSPRGRRPMRPLTGLVGGSPAAVADGTHPGSPATTSLSPTLQGDHHGNEN